jgi:hypothetical protein
MPANWEGPPDPDASGNIEVAGFNDFLKDHPNLRRSPTRATIRFVDLEDPNALKTTVNAEANQLEAADQVRVVLTEDGYSIQAIRYALEFERTNGNWRLKSARRTQRCQPGRGHQDFSPQPCQ